MQFDDVSRRRFSAGLGTIAAIAVAGEAHARASRNDAKAEITHSHAAIHQEIAFPAPAARLYRILTSADEFDRVVQASGALHSAMKSKLGTEATRIDARPGGAFVFFGGYITGFNLELAPDTRLVQAWRSAGWDKGMFSIARFAFVANGSRTTIVFDHTGFPDGDAEHLAQGWYLNYWKPLAKVLSENP